MQTLGEEKKKQDQCTFRTYFVGVDFSVWLERKRADVTGPLFGQGDAEKVTLFAVKWSHLKKKKETYNASNCNLKQFAGVI